MDDANGDVMLHDDRVGIPVEGGVGDGGDERAAPSRLLQGRLRPSRKRGVKDGLTLVTDGGFEIRQAATADGRDVAGRSSSG